MSYLLHFGVSLIVFSVFLVIAEAQYEVPEVRVEALSPRGLRVSIEHEDGISLFAFHGKINEEMNGREAGTFSVDINKPKDGRWTYLTKAPKLKVGDRVNYWVNVDFNDGNGKRGYIKDDQTFIVTQLVPDGSTITTSTTSTTTTTTLPPPTPVPSPPPFTVSGCKPSPTKVNGREKCKGDLIFEENFGTLSDKRWFPEVRFAGDPDNEFVIYQNSKENLYVEKNKLHIKPTILEDKYGKDYVFTRSGLDLGESCTGIHGTFDCVQKPKAWMILPPVLSAQISTKNHFSFVYGVVEIQARFPKGDWIYPELYLIPRNDDYGQGLNSGLIRIAYTPGNQDYSNTLHGGCILGKSDAARNYAQKSITSQKHWNNATHTFRLEWKTDSITVSVNKQVYGNIYPPEGGFVAVHEQLEVPPDTAERWRSGSQLAPFDREMYIVLGVGVGGQTFPNVDSGKKPWDNNDPKRQLSFYKATETWRQTWNEASELVVDSVKVWAI